MPSVSSLFIVCCLCLVWCLLTALLILAWRQIINLSRNWKKRQEIAEIHHFFSTYNIAKLSLRAIIMASLVSLAQLLFSLVCFWSSTYGPSSSLDNTIVFVFGIKSASHETIFFKKGPTVPAWVQRTCLRQIMHFHCYYQVED